MHPFTYPYIIQLLCLKPASDLSQRGQPTRGVVTNLEDGSVSLCDITEVTWQEMLEPLAAATSRLASCVTC